MHTIVQDNASNVKKAMNGLGVTTLRCFAYLLQLLILEGLMSQQSIFETFAVQFEYLP